MKSYNLMTEKQMEKVEGGFVITVAMLSWVAIALGGVASTLVGVIAGLETKCK